jgi:hypothetical protein
MAKKNNATPSRYDRAVIKDFARCFARAAVDRLIDEAEADAAPDSGLKKDQPKEDSREPA